MVSVNITPSPRVLRMLGQIDFAPWQCLAELIDNSVDAFIEQLGSGFPPTNPKISISLPTEAQLKSGMGVIEISDNGTGMELADLQNAVRAGYSGNDPVEKMGLFGMGFNISTARLGRRTEVWTTSRESGEWTGIVIDFDVLEQAGTFEAPIQFKEKTADELAGDMHGTRINISRLEIDRIRPLIRGAGKRQSINRLGKIYGRVMSTLGITISYDGDKVHPRMHCVWDKKRSVDTTAFGKVHAIMEIDETLASRRFCTTCWVWLSDVEEHCNACGHSDHVIDRKRTVRGWLGIQRYFHKNHFGVDLIRNGRVIEELDKSFFNFEDENGEVILEYPIDAIHWGGRIVGELEIDFVRVSHQKDAFDKLDPEWKKVVEVVRGSSPMQPMIAKRIGLPTNGSPLARLFSGFRKGHAGLKDLVPGTAQGVGMNSGIINDYVDRFYNGEEDFQSDDKWYELVLQAERGKRGGGSTGSDDAAGAYPFDDDTEEAVADQGESTQRPVDDADKRQTSHENIEKDIRLSRAYELETLPGSPVVNVEAFAHSKDVNGKPYSVRPDGYTFRFDYNNRSKYFEESLEKPVDCLLTDLSNHFLALSSQTIRDYPVSRIARELREKYFPELVVSAELVAANAASIIDALKRHLSETLVEMAPIDPMAINADQIAHIQRAAQRAEAASKSDVADKINAGLFVPYTTDSFVPAIIEKWPSLVTNGRFFITPYEPDATGHGDRQPIHELVEMISEVLWLKEDGISAINKDLYWQLRFARSVASMRLLESWRS